MVDRTGPRAVDGPLRHPCRARWPDAIDQALRDSGVIVGILSPASLASDNVKNEWDWAIARQKQLILLMVEPCELPFHYVSINYLDFVDSGDAGYASLAAALFDGERPEHLEPDTVVDGPVYPPAVMHSGAAGWSRIRLLHVHHGCDRR